MNKNYKNDDKCKSLTYVGKETKLITKLFRNINISYKTNNNTEKKSCLQTGGIYRHIQWKLHTCTKISRLWKVIPGTNRKVLQN
jgi:hypothetical protein